MKITLSAWAAASMCLSVSIAAVAGSPVTLTDRQLDRVTAGDTPPRVRHVCRGRCWARAEGIWWHPNDGGHRGRLAGQ